MSTNQRLVDLHIYKSYSILNILLIIINDANINKYFELLDTINSQASEVQQNIEKLQLENQASHNKIKRLVIVKEYLEEVEEEEGTENE